MRRVLTELGVAFVVLALAPASAHAADPLDPATASSIREYVEREMASLGVPGAAVVVVNRDQIVFAEGFGRADDDDRPVTPQTPFDLASVSKSLTAIAALLEVQAGRLDLDATVTRYLDWFDDAQAAYGEVTVRQLLGHQGGWTEGDGRANLADTYAGTDAVERNVRRLAAIPPAHVGVFEYSNANYDVLAHIVEVTSGIAFADYVEERLFAPLAMEHAHASREAAVDDGLAQGYYPAFGLPVAYESPHVPGGIGSAFLFASAEDLGHALILHLNEGHYGGAEVLSPDLVAELQRPISQPDQNSGYGSGWWTYPLWMAGGMVEGSEPPAYDVPVMYEHGGDHASVATSILFLPEEGWGVVALLNLNDAGASSRYHQLHTGIAAILLGAEPGVTVAYEDAVSQYVRGIVLGVIGVQIAGIWWALRRLNRWRRDPTSRPRRVLGTALHVVLPLVVDVAITAAFWLLIANRAPGTPLEVVIRYAPDVTAAIGVISILGVGWGLLRTAMTVRTLRADLGGSA